MIKESDGSLQVQYTTTLPRILGEFDTGTADGALSFPTLAGGTPFFFIVGSAGIASFLNMPVIVASGTTISWYFVSPEERLSVRVAFGRIG